MLPDGLLVPMYYYTPRYYVDDERARPGSQPKCPSAEGTTDGVFMWGQALYFIVQLLGEWPSVCCGSGNSAGVGFIDK